MELYILTLQAAFEAKIYEFQLLFAHYKYEEGAGKEDQTLYLKWQQT